MREQASPLCGPHVPESAEEAHERYYQALASQCLPEMEEVWLAGPESRCVHAGWPVLRGWNAIRPSWAAIFRSLRDIEIEAHQLSAESDGEWAWFHSQELMSCTGERDRRMYRLTVVQVFRWRPEGWKMMLHHAAEMEHTEFIC